MSSESFPNIILLFNDHQAFYRHGWDGGVQPERPHFDRLAREGVRFDRAYTVCPLCVPARRSVLTGLFPHNHGLTTNDESAPIRDEGALYPELEDKEYRMFSFGKWHAGPANCGGPPIWPPLPGGPDSARGFRVEGISYPGFGNPYTTPEYACYLERHGLPPASFDVKHMFSEPFSPDDTRLGPGYQCLADEFHPHATGLLETPPETHESFFLANEACDTLQQLAAEDDERPFFLRVDFYGPHAPYFASPEYVQRYDPHEITPYGSFCDDLAGKPSVWHRETNEPIAQGDQLILPSTLDWDTWAEILTYVYGHITQIDAAGGIILDELDRLGLSENTLVIWTTDHGDPVASHGGHFGKEAYMSEEVLRIPMAMRWPGFIRSGQVTNALVSNVDVPATIMGALGRMFHEAIDGRSMLDIVGPWAEVDPIDWRQDLLCETHGHHGEQVIGRTVVTRRFKYTEYFHHDTGVAEAELYDLDKDTYEMHNLFGQEGYGDVAKDLKIRLRAWQMRSNDRAALEMML